MVLATTNSTAGKYRIYEGTAQEVLDAMDGISYSKFRAMGHNGTSYFLMYDL